MHTYTYSDQYTNSCIQTYIKYNIGLLNAYKLYIDVWQILYYKCFNVINSILMLSEVNNNRRTSMEMQFCEAKNSEVLNFVPLTQLLNSASVPLHKYKAILVITTVSRGSNVPSHPETQVSFPTLLWSVAVRIHTWFLHHNHCSPTQHSATPICLNSWIRGNTMAYP